MPDTAPRPVHLSDYQPFTHLVRAVDLTFHLACKATRVIALLSMAPNPVRPGRHDLRLDGEGLALIRLAVDGRPVFSVQYHPEASPGPHDGHYLFDKFAQAMRDRRAA